MTTSTAAPIARRRNRRTRTSNVSCLPALLVSQLPLTSVELTHRAEHLVCPACKTWCPLTLNKGSREWKLVPHHTAPAGTPGSRRCPNSNRLVVVDVKLARWQQKRFEASADVAARRPTTVLKKVKTPVVPAITQLTPAAPTADTARAAYYAHRDRCAGRKDHTTREASTTGCSGARLCIDGARLYATYMQLLGQEPERRAAQARAEQEQRTAEPEQAKKRLQRRADEWSAAHVDALIEKRRWAQLEHFTGDLVEPIRGAAVPKGARPIGTVRSADDVLDENPIRKNQPQQQLSA
ncbi:hypothetical protein ABZ747_18075 [Kitasatospora cineracea]|uniref:hypothetical protein n=1 Tax=Kitasatospora cineracea TaxID=88074 RepID=UPI0033CC2476